MFEKSVGMRKRIPIFRFIFDNNFINYSVKAKIVVFFDIECPFKKW